MHAIESTQTPFRSCLLSLQVLNNVFCQPGRRPTTDNDVIPTANSTTTTAAAAADNSCGNFADEVHCPATYWTRTGPGETALTSAADQCRHYHHQHHHHLHYQQPQQLQSPSIVASLHGPRWTGVRTHFYEVPVTDWNDT